MLNLLNNLKTINLNVILFYNLWKRRFYYGNYLHEIKPNKFIFDYFYSINIIKNN
jgi:hypothetical protein